MDELHDKSMLHEERIANHFANRVMANHAPPVSYRVGMRAFDAIALRTNCRIEFGDRNPDGTRPEHITLHTVCGSLRVYLGHDCDHLEIKTTEYSNVNQ